MKNITKLLYILFFAIIYSNLYAQSDSSKLEMKIITKHDGIKYTGVILKDDGREVHIRTEKIGELYIPKHEIESIEDFDPKLFSKEGQYIGEDLFATRYAFTTNALALKKGENYVLLNLFGPDLTFGIAKNFNVGVMTSWIGAPLIVTAKGTIPINENLNIGLGALAGWGGPWPILNTSFGGLPFASFTVGNRINNFTINAGYLIVTYPGGNSPRDIFTRPMLGVGAMAKISKKISFIFDSFILPTNPDAVAVIMPGLRFQSKVREFERAFGFNLNIIYADGSLIPIPLPNFQWFIKL